MPFPLEQVVDNYRLTQSLLTDFPLQGWISLRPPSTNAKGQVMAEMH